MRHRFFIDTSSECRVHPRQFNRLIDSLSSSDEEFILSRLPKTINGDMRVLIVGECAFIEDANAEEGEA